MLELKAQKRNLKLDETPEMNDPVHQKTDSRPLEWLHHTEYFAEMVYQNARLRLGRNPTLIDIIQGLEVTPAGQTVPVRFSLKLEEAEDDKSIGRITLNTQGDAALIHATKITPRTTSFVIAALLGAVILGAAGPGQSVEYFAPQSIPEDKKRFARSLLMKLDLPTGQTRQLQNRSER